MPYFHLQSACRLAVLMLCAFCCDKPQKKDQEAERATLMIFLNLYYHSLFSRMSCASGKNTLQNLFKNKSFLYKCLPPSQSGLSCSADINGTSRRLSPKALVLSSSSFHSFPPSLKDLSCLSPEPTYTSFAHNLGLTVPFADGNSFSFAFPFCNMLSRN